MHGRAIVDNMCEFQRSYSRADCTFLCKIRESNAEVPFNKETEKARLPTNSCLYNSKRPSLVSCILTAPECRSGHHDSGTITAWSRQSVCSLSSSRVSGLLKVIRQVGRSVSLHEISHCVLLLLCPCFAHCCHDPFIVRSTQTSPPFLVFTQLAHPSRCSRSTLTTVCFCFCFSAGVSDSAASAPDPSPAVYERRLCRSVQTSRLPRLTV